MHDEILKSIDSTSILRTMSARQNSRSIYMHSNDSTWEASPMWCTSRSLGPTLSGALSTPTVKRSFKNIEAFAQDFYKTEANKRLQEAPVGTIHMLPR